MADASLTSAELLKTLDAINKKLQDASALNGGFDTLMMKITAIEEGQRQIGEEVKSIRAAIYEPDTGLFARVKRVDTERQAADGQVNMRVDRIQEKLDSTDREREKASQQDKEQLERFDKVANDVAEISKWKKAVNAVAIWAAGGAATGAFGFLAKFIYALISAH